MAAAAQDENADASIGNITGSNSVNVFLGIGIPWVLATLYVKLYIKWFNRRLVLCNKLYVVFSMSSTQH